MVRETRVIRARARAHPHPFEVPSAARSILAEETNPTSANKEHKLSSSTSPDRFPTNSVFLPSTASALPGPRSGRNYIHTYIHTYSTRYRNYTQTLS